MKWKKQSPKLGIHSDYKYTKKHKNILKNWKEIQQQETNAYVQVGDGFFFFFCNLVALSLQLKP